ncbi:MAG: hypothetical protein GX651_03505 [Methanomicrobiales archaeon]|nr:hypothetical protein [Methanomicrobiales archaeon]
MHYRAIALFLLVAAAALVSGCTQTDAPAATPAPTVALDAETVAAPSATIALGEEYFHKKFSFQSENDVFTEQFRVTNDPWAVDFVVNPMHTDPQYTWFEVKVTNMDTGRIETFGYGRTHPLDLHQQHPMYNAGPYKFEFRGNRVSVDVTVAKRNP